MMLARFWIKILCCLELVLHDLRMSGVNQSSQSIRFRKKNYERNAVVVVLVKDFQKVDMLIFGIIFVID